MSEFSERLEYLRDTKEIFDLETDRLEMIVDHHSRDYARVHSLARDMVFS